ncbi:surface-adhesin E family protein [Chromobacterium subtsugae]|uniref:surface-adhesin E family protein n=1 Tax=Chromobacterium subtsugae TaxID=251747 RepID=UPI000A5F25ED|nr:surface-adhesin E family protein [Chromobacterium subtsugae]
MRLFFLSVFVLIFPLCSSAANWESVLGMADDGVAYLDSSSVSRHGSNVKFWVKVSYPLPHPSKACPGQLYVNHSELMIINCADKTIGTSQFNQNALDGNVVCSFKYNRIDMEDIVPESLGDKLKDIACKGSSRPGVKTKTF